MANEPEKGLSTLELVEVAMLGHRWSGWPGAWCLDCGLEDANELDLAGPPERVHHRYSDTVHTAQPCAGCSNRPCEKVGEHLHDPYWHD